MHLDPFLYLFDDYIWYLRTVNKPPVARAELRQMVDSLLHAMERMLDARIPADGQRAPQHQYDESGAENSDAGHDHF